MSFRETTWLVPDGCPYLADGPDGDPYWRCGQGWGHDGDHAWWTPGIYIPPPLISPLAWLAARLRSPWPWHSHCPLCGAWASEIRCEPTLCVYGDAEDAERDEVRWEFRPCGCEGRELADPAV